MDDALANLAAFYDDLAPSYDRIFADWKSSIARQGAVLDGIIRAEIGDRSWRVLDCACGIGTQTFGLADAGHRIVGTDLSAGAVRRARSEMAIAGRDIPLAVADMRRLPFCSGAADVVVCADNALPHLLTEQDVLAAFAEFTRVLRPGGIALLSIRDYDSLGRPELTPASLSTDADGLRTITVQVWDWFAERPIYAMTHLQMTEQEDGGWSVRPRRATYRAWRREELSHLSATVGFASSVWRMPNDSGFFQPLLVLRAAD